MLTQPYYTAGKFTSADVQQIKTAFHNNLLGVERDGVMQVPL